MSNRCLIRRGSIGNISSENYKHVRSRECQKPVYRNDQYAKSTSVDSSIKNGRKTYNTIINNINNRNNTLKVIPFINLSNNKIYEYLLPHTTIGALNINNSNYFYEYSIFSNYFYIKNNILYSKKKFIFDEQHSYDITIEARKCNSNECLSRKFTIDIISSAEIKRVLDVCEIDHYNTNNLLSYLSIKDRNKIYILLNIKWFNYYDDQIIKKDYIQDRSFITDKEQFYDIYIETEFIDENNNTSLLSNVFSKKVLNNVSVVGDLIEHSTLALQFNDDSNNNYVKFNKYFWWNMKSNNDIKIVLSRNTKEYTLSSFDVGKKIAVSALYRNDDTIVIKTISPITDRVKNINNLPTGGVNIIGNTTIGQILYVTDNISDLDGIASSGKIITWYKSYKNEGDVSNVTYEWQYSFDENENKTWNTISDTNKKTFLIPYDNLYKNSFFRVKASTYDIYGNNKIFYSNSSNKLEYKEKENQTYKYLISGTAKLGETLQIVDKDNKPLSKSKKYEFIWYRSKNEVDWVKINTNTTNPYLMLPVTEEYIYMDQHIKATVIFYNKTAKFTYDTNYTDAIVKYNVFKNGSLTINGKAIEGSIISAMLNTSINTDNYIIQYIWEISKDKISWKQLTTDSNYSMNTNDNSLDYDRTEKNDDLVITLDNKSMKIPKNGTMIGYYVKCSVLFTNNYKTEYLVSNISSKIINLDSKATGNLKIEGTAIVGSTINAILSNLYDIDGEILSTSYQWQYNNNDTWVNFGLNNYDLHILDDINNKEIRVLATTIDSVGGSTLFYSSNNVVIKEGDDNNDDVFISGKTIEGGILEVNTNINIIKENIIKYTWKYTFDKNTIYTLPFANNKATLYIPDNNTYIGKYIFIEIIYKNKDGSFKTYKSPYTNKIQYLNNNTEGMLSIAGTPITGQELSAEFTGLFDEDNIYLDENNNPYRENNLLLTKKDNDYKFKTSISYYDKYNNYSTIFSEYTPVITEENSEFDIPDSPCYFLTSVSEPEFLHSLDNCKHVILGPGGIVNLNNDLILKGGERIVVDGGTFNIVNANFTILNFGQFVVKDLGTFNLNGNLTINKKAVYNSDNSIKTNIEDLIQLEPSRQCIINSLIKYDVFLGIYNNCDFVNIITNGIVDIYKTFTISKDKTIIVNNNGILRIFNSDLILEDGSTLIIYGDLIISGTLTILGNATFTIANNGKFISREVLYNKIYITTKITINELNNYFINNYEITIGETGIIDENGNDLIIDSSKSLIIYGEITLRNCELKVEIGGVLKVFGTLNLISVTTSYHSESTILFDENSTIDISE